MAKIMLNGPGPVHVAVIWRALAAGMARHLTVNMRKENRAAFPARATMR